MGLTKRKDSYYVEFPVLDDGKGVLPHFYGHLGKAHNEPGGCHDTAAEIFSGVQA